MIGEWIVQKLALEGGECDIRSTCANSFCAVPGPRNSMQIVFLVDGLFRRRNSFSIRFGFDR